MICFTQAAFKFKLAAMSFEFAFLWAQLIMLALILLHFLSAFSLLNIFQLMASLRLNSSNIERTFPVSRYAPFFSFFLSFQDIIRTA
jgi:hypothetical protein